MKTSNPNFYNQLYGGVDGMGLAGAWLSDALNTNAHTFEVAPVFLIVERGLCRYVEITMSESATGPYCMHAASSLTG